MPRTWDPKAEDLFVTCEPDIQAIALQARRLVLSVMPGAIELAENGNTMVHFGTGRKMADEVFYVSAHRSHVNVGLFGADLPDPKGLMEGTGKRLRHVKLKKVEDVDDPALRKLLETAYARHQE